MITAYGRKQLVKSYLRVEKQKSQSCCTKLICFSVFLWNSNSSLRWQERWLCKLPGQVQRDKELHERTLQSDLQLLQHAFLAYEREILRKWRSQNGSYCKKNASPYSIQLSFTRSSGYTQKKRFFWIDTWIKYLCQKPKLAKRHNICGNRGYMEIQIRATKATWKPRE